MDGTETGWGRPAEPAPRWRALLDRALLGARTDEQEQVSDTGEEPSPVSASTAGPPLPSRPVSPIDRRPRNPLDQHASYSPPGPGSAQSDQPPWVEPHWGPPTDQRAIERAPEQRAIGSRSADTRGANPWGAESGGANPWGAESGGADSRGAETRRMEPWGADSRAVEQRPASPPPVRPINPLDRRPGRERAAGALEQRRPHTGERPVNPLDRRPPRSPEGFGGRTEPAEAPGSFFNPATRAVPPPIARVTRDTGYPPARAAASVGSAAVVPPPDVAAHLEWRQTRPDVETERSAAVLRRQLSKPRVLAFANPKGGVHKTTATVLAAASMGSVRGRGVLAWDDNELRGTLGLRAGSARHARTIRHLVADLLQIENLHGADLTERLDDYLRHASDGSYDVLAGDEDPRFAQRLDQHTVRRVVELLRRTHEVICVDTGNNVESVNWQTVMGSADQLVITTVPREDAAFTADWMLDLLVESGMEDLVANAVTLLSCPTNGRLPLLEDLKRHFATRTRAVTVVPYDPALEIGSSIDYDVLQPETKRAWLRATAVMLEPFTQ